MFQHREEMYIIVKVKIEDIIEGIEMHSYDNRVFLNGKTGEVVSVLQEFLGNAEDGESFAELPDWQQEQMQIAYDIIEDEENYLSLPSEFDIHEYSMMEDFCFSVSDPKAKDILLRAIKGKGAFRRFKDRAFDLDLIEKWYDYRETCYKQIAIEFCERNNFDYVE